MDGFGWTSWLQIGIVADVALASIRAGWSIRWFAQRSGRRCLSCPSRRHLHQVKGGGREQKEQEFE